MTDILMPALSPTMEEGTLSKWFVKEGDAVRAGDVIAEIETDKATMEVEAVDEGVIAKLLVPEGTENVKVKTPIATLQNGEDKGAKPAAQAPHPQRAQPQMKQEPVAQRAEPSKVKAEAPQTEPQIPAGTKTVKL